MVRRALARLGDYASFVKVEHTLFALPFALSGALLAAHGEGRWPTGRELLWIGLAMLGARNAAMGLNRIIDRHIDARNPRTKGRHLPAGRLTTAEAWAFVTASLALLLLAAWRLNPLCVRLFPAAVVALAVYPYAKRFTWTCHYWMVPAQFLAPFGAWIAVTGRLSWEPVLLGLAVGLWIAGFDILYALQDLEFDRAHGVRSLPARFGVAAALWVARATHLASLALLLAAGRALGLGPAFHAGLLAMAGIMIYQHSLVSPREWSRAARAFQANLAVGPLLLAGVLVELLGAAT